MNDEDNVSKTYEDSFDVMEFKNRLRDSAKSVKGRLYK